MKRIGFVLHWHREEVLFLAKRALRWCQEADDIQVVMPERDAQLMGKPEFAVSDDSFGAEMDMCLSIGGDGTILRTASLVSSFEVPIMGINCGRLGYLAEIDAEHIEEALSLWSEEKLSVEERMMLAIELPESLSSGSPERYALNEAVLYRSDSGRSIRLGTSIAGKPFMSYTADAIILSTPTGSTAYSLSAGGPIVEPDFQAMVLTPVAAHTAFDRSMVLAPETKVTFTVEGYRPADLALDGRVIAELEPGQSIVCSAARHKTKLLQQNPRNFHSILKDKFGLQTPTDYGDL